MKKICSEACLLTLLVLAIDFTICTEETLDYREIQKFLSDYESNIRFPEGYKDVVLVMGLTGSGKSTFTQWIAGDDSKLISVEVGDGTGEYIIIDNSRIGNSTTISKTIYPELVEDYDSGKVRNGYYDLPGFADSRGVKHDIATSYFIKRILEDCSDYQTCHINRIKILLVVNYSSVRFGVDRKSLRRLLTHVTELLKNTDRYLDGIGLVVTKVENIPIMRRDGSFHLVSDTAIISNVAAFLQNVAADIESEGQSSESNLYKQSIGNKSVALLIALATHSDERIALFRRPNEAGPLNEITLLQEAKQRLNLLVEKLKPIATKNDDFGYSVSDATRNKLYNVIDATQSGLEKNIELFANNLYKHYTNNVELIYYKIKHEVNLQDMTDVNIVIIEIQKLVNELKGSIGEINKLDQQLDNVKKYKIIPTFIKETLFNLNLNISPPILLDISIQAFFLDFLKESLDLKIHINSLNLALQKIGLKMVQLSKNVEVGVYQILVDVDNKIKSDINSTFLELKQEFDSYEIGAYDLQVLQNKTDFFCDTIVEVQKLSDPKEKLQALNRSIEAHNIAIPKYILQHIEDEKYCSFFTKEIDSFVTYMLNSKAWYIFLNKLYGKVSSFAVQSDKTAKEHCKAFEQDSMDYEGRKVKDTNIGFILRNCDSNLYDNGFEDIKNIILSKSKIGLLNNLVNFTINGNIITQSCNETRFITKGHFVKISDVNLNTCTSATYIQIFASEKVFIDQDMDFTGKNIQISVLAPTWEVVGIRKVTLDGSPGNNIERWDTTIDGKPGMPGGNSGDFLGYGDRFVNGENLLISANGGVGGPGQDGLNGGDGEDGVIPDYPYSGLYYGAARNGNLNPDYWVEHGFIKGATSCKKEYDTELENCIDYYLLGKNCTDGADGGLGGEGGEGGLAGTVKILFDAPFIISSSDGPRGIDGDPGSGGHAGSPYGEKVVREIKYRYIFGLVYARQYEKISSDIHRCSNGIKPLFRVNTKEKIEALPKRSFMNQTTIFNEFRSYLEDHLESTMNKKILSKSIQKCYQLSIPQDN